MSLASELDTIFASACADSVFSAAAIAVERIDEYKINRIITANYGYNETRLKKDPVSPATFFDLASLTKPLVTVLTLLPLLQQSCLLLEDSLGDIGGFGGLAVPEDKQAIQLWQLLAHCSGLAAHRPYYTRLLAIAASRRRHELLRLILAEPLIYRPGTRHLYSDLGFMLLGAIIEQRTGMSLDACFRQSVSRPLGLDSQLLFPRRGDLDITGCAATEVCPWSHELLAGVVHDDNCRALGGVAGHAGLFGTAVGVLALCSHLCMVWQGKVQRSPFSTELLRRMATRIGNSTWSCGFDTPTRFASSSGRYFSGESIGHLGFTGTSFWIDLRRGISVVLLTNRVHPSRDDQRIKRFRPGVHDIVMEHLLR